MNERQGRHRRKPFQQHHHPSYTSYTLLNRLSPDRADAYAKRICTTLCRLDLVSHCGRRSNVLAVRIDE
jgi:hypothetical protein